MTDFTPGKNLR